MLFVFDTTVDTAMPLHPDAYMSSIQELYSKLFFPTLGQRVDVHSKTITFSACTHSQQLFIVSSSTIVWFNSHYFHRAVVSLICMALFPDGA